MSAAADTGLLRFLRARVDETLVLNSLSATEPVRSCLPERLAACAAELGGEAVSDNGHEVDYQRLRGLPVYRTLQILTASLPHFDLAGLTDRAEQIAFWLNVYNALTVDAVVQFELEVSIRRLPGFFRRAAYRIGGHRFSAEEIEHGVLRGNSPPLKGRPAPFAAGDPRLASVVKPADGRIHFALNCGTRSCPSLRAYDARNLDCELEHAARQFVAETTHLASGSLMISPLFSLYLEDFGGLRGLQEHLARLVPARLEPLLRRTFEERRVEFDGYDWTLNAPSPPTA